MRISDWSSDVCSADLGVGRAHRRWPVRRLLGLSRAADGADAGGGDRGLVALAAVRQRRGGAVGALGGLSSLYAIDPARGGLAMAHPAPASHRQRLCLFERRYFGRRGGGEDRKSVV